MAAAAAQIQLNPKKEGNDETTNGDLGTRNRNRVDGGLVDPVMKDEMELVDREIGNQIDNLLRMDAAEDARRLLNAWTKIKETRNETGIQKSDSQAVPRA